jgi:cytochrome c oxidase assembly factor CtaG
MKGARHRRQRQMMPLERTGAFTLGCVAVLALAIVVVLAMAFLS